jgi:DNA-binding FadR family transcriptional regulator
VTLRLTRTSFQLPRSARLPHRVLAEAIRSGDEERARRTARAIVRGPM